MRGGALLVFVLAAPLLAQEWFDEYTRGLEALRQGQGARAVELFERAIRKRPEPGNNIITYGTNRLDQYHPYLRMAQAQLLMGNLEGARDALKRSEQRGKEPPQERGRLTNQLEAALEKARAAAATPPPTLVAAQPTPPPPTPVTLAAAPTPVIPAPLPASAASPSLPPPSAAATPGPAAMGTLEVRSVPEGATVFARGRLLGITPLTTDLAPGAYQITLRKEGSADESFSVQVEAGKRALADRTLVATAPVPTPAPGETPVEVASLVVYSIPPGASVYLDDEAIGATDPGSGRLVKSGVAPGTHRLRLSRQGHQDLVQDVNVAPAGPTTLRGTLDPAPRRDLTPALAGLAAAVVLVGLAGFTVWRRRRPAEPRSGTRVLTSAPRASPTPRPSATQTTPSRRKTVVVSEPTQADWTPSSLVPDAPTSALSPGTKVSGAQNQFGEYRLLEQLGRGGMAAVFKAERNGEVCALKRPLSAFLEDPEFMERFLREAEIGRTLHHPNIIRIFERGRVGGVPYFTMELVQGETLQALVRREGALDPRAATRLVAQVAEALDYAHLKGVVHRDLKPSNIMVLQNGVVKVMDYGIARARRFEGLTVTGAFLGTPDYVAPETAEGKGTDARSDLYSLGIVFYEILTSKKPFVADTPFATLKKHCTEPPPPPSTVSPGVPRELESIVLRLLRKTPEERYPGAEELLIELRDYLNRAA